MNYKKIEMTEDYYNKLIEICCDVYDMYGSEEYTLSMLDDVALQLFELTSKQFDPDNYVISKHEQLKEDITHTLYIKLNLLDKECYKLKEELQEEYERKYEKFKDDLLKAYKQ